jgi:hypothetical protein
VCIGGFFDCVTDIRQVEDIIEEARLAQGIFEAGERGWVRGEYVFEQALLLCSAWGSPHECGQVADSQYPNGFRDMLPEDAVAAATVIVVGLPAPGIEVNPEWKRRVAGAIGISAGGLVVSAVVNSVLEALEASVESCYRNTDLSRYSSSAPYRNPCDSAPVFSPETNAQEAAEHDLDAILARPDRVRLTYATEAEQRARGVTRRWYDNVSPCDSAGRAAAQQARPGELLDCDEYPYYRTSEGGPGASLRMVLRGDNRSEGASLGVFYKKCPNVSASAPTNREPYLVAPQFVTPTLSHCGGRL